MKRVKFVGLDVHAETIAIAVAEPGGEVRSLGVIPNREDSVRKLVRKLGPVEELRFCYEAGPTGYVLYWQLTRMGAKCEVVAPTLVPVKSGDRVKTDRRDALKLARNYRAGELTPVWVPDAAHEALRDLVRAREAAKKDELRARHRLNKFLLRHGRRPPMGVKALDDEVPGVGETGSAFRTDGSGSYAGGLPTRGGTRGRTHHAARWCDCRSREVRTTEDACGDRGIAGATRNRARCSGNGGRRTWRTVPVCQSKAVNGLRRNRGQ
jgi:hypothetical protein